MKNTLQYDNFTCSVPQFIAKDDAETFILAVQSNDRNSLDQLVEGIRLNRGTKVQHLRTDGDTEYFKGTSEDLKILAKDLGDRKVISEGTAIGVRMRIELAEKERSSSARTNYGYSNNRELGNLHPGGGVFG